MIFWLHVLRKFEINSKSMCLQSQAHTVNDWCSSATFARRNKYILATRLVVHLIWHVFEYSYAWSRDHLTLNGISNYYFLTSHFRTSQKRIIWCNSECFATGTALLTFLYSHQWTCLFQRLTEVLTRKRTKYNFEFLLTLSRKVDIHKEFSCSCFVGMSSLYFPWRSLNKVTFSITLATESFTRYSSFHLVCPCEWFATHVTGMWNSRSNQVFHSSRFVYTLDGIGLPTV